MNPVVTATPSPFLLMPHRSTEERVVVRMGADPCPHDPAVVKGSDSAVVTPDAN